jgi:hypothetical protein
VAGVQQALVKQGRAQLAGAFDEQAAMKEITANFRSLFVARNSLGVQLQRVVQKRGLFDQPGVVRRRIGANETPAAFIMAFDALALDQRPDHLIGGQTFAQ